MSSRKYSTLLMAAVTLMMVCAVQTASASNDPNRSSLHKVTESYLQQFDSVNDWWLEATPKVSPEASEALFHRADEVQQIVKRSRLVSKSTQAIAATFPNFRSTFFVKGSSMSIHSKVGNLDSIKGLEVCHVPKNEFRARRFPALLYYREDWRAVMVAGVNWPKIFLSGVVYHELSHALNHRNRSVVIKSQTQEQWFEEEVVGHELEGRVINSLTSGKYYRVIDRMIAARPLAKTPAELLASISSKDLLELDTIIGAQKSGAEIRSSSVAQHLLSLGFRFIDSKKVGSKVAHYRWVAER